MGAVIRLWDSLGPWVVALALAVACGATWAGIRDGMTLLGSQTASTSGGMVSLAVPDGAMVHCSRGNGTVPPGLFAWWAQWSCGTVLDGQTEVSFAVAETDQLWSDELQAFIDVPIPTWSVEFYGVAGGKIDDETALVLTWGVITLWIVAAGFKVMARTVWGA